MKRYQTMLFDLDGTILDTNELIIRSFLEALQDYVPDTFDRSHIIPGMGLPLVDQMRKFTGLDDVSDLIQAYREINLRLHDELVKPFEHVTSVLERLHGLGVKIGIVTTKMRLTTDKGLAFVGIDRYIDAVVTIDDVTHAKPHPEPVEQALALLGASPDSALMLGDSVVDIEAAAAAGVTPIGVAWSLKGADRLRQAGAEYVIDDMRELYAFAGAEREPIEKG